jgi:tripartite-type tricarboxylate transporter receptor subunit TctC
VKARLAALGIVPMPATPSEFGTFIAAETEKWAKVIRAANIRRTETLVRRPGSAQVIIFPP